MPSVCAPSTSSGYVSTAVYAEPCSASSPTWGPLPCERTSSCSSAIGASARQAACAFSRWLDADSSCPRRSRALPPRATTTRTSAPERRDHHGLDRVHAVLGLVEDDRRGRLEDLLGDLQRGQPELLEEL